MDAIDEQILVRLVRNARATFAEIGAEVSLSAPAVKRRVDKLIKDGTIEGFTTIVDPGSLGWNTEAFVSIFCKGTVSPEDLRKAWEPIPEVVSASTVTGMPDAILKVRARDVQHLERALERIRDEPTIDHTESIIVLSRLIERSS